MVCYRSTNQGLGIWPFESYIWLYLPLNVRHLIFCLTFSLITCYRTDLINTVLLEMGFVWLNLYCSLTVSLELSGSVSAWWYWDTKMAVVIHQGLSVRHFIPFIVSSYIIKKLETLIRHSWMTLSDVCPCHQLRALRRFPSLEKCQLLLTDKVYGFLSNNNGNELPNYGAKLIVSY